MNLTGGVLATRPPGKTLNGLFGERFSTDKRLVEDLTGGFLLGKPQWVLLGYNLALPWSAPAWRLSPPGEGSRHRNRQEAT